jgi:hypothetical protein
MKEPTITNRMIVAGGAIRILLEARSVRAV